MRIKAVTAKQILDSRGVPTVEVELETKEGLFAAAVPSGTSSGKYEALEKRDGGEAFSGKGVQKAVYNVREVIGPFILKQTFSGLRELDESLIEMAGKNKAKLGANAVLPVSMACCRALAAAENLPLYSYISQIYGTPPAIGLPKPCVLLIEGAKHAANNLDVQEFMVVGQGDSFAESYKTAVEVYERLKQALKERFREKGQGIGYEGGFAPPLEKAEDALNEIMEAAEAAGLKDNVEIGLDVAASEFFQKGKYNFQGKEKSREEMLEFYSQLVKKYPILFIEDPFAEDDLEGWHSTKALQDRGVLIVGDDLTVTNPQRMASVERKGLCNAVIIKPNQIGTVTEAMEAAKTAKEFGWKRIVSHRSGDTTDGFIADLAAGIASEFIKSGGPHEKERKAKYNRLLQIERGLL